MPRYKHYVLSKMGIIWCAHFMIYKNT